MKYAAFLTGSQYLYGGEALEAVAADSVRIAEYLDKAACGARVKFKGVTKTSDEIVATGKQINSDDACIGVIVWCHTFSPAKMWINGLKLLQKPLLHLHTQANRELPYDEIDMDFMNLNQAAHGDREFAYILTRMGIVRKSVVGYYEEEDTVKEINLWLDLARAYDYSSKLKICRFGDNMRDVAVTEGDKVEAHIRFGWQTDYYGIGDLAEEICAVSEEEVNALYSETLKRYELNTDNVAAVKEQIKYAIALRRFLDRAGYKAFTTNFQDLHGLRQLPGMAVQLLMADGYGFGAEGDWKIAALGAVMREMAKYRKGSTAFMEDYTYDLTHGRELVLGAHMLEVCPTMAATRPKIEVHPLGIGGKEPPARLVFDGICGDAIAVCMTDTGKGLRLICAEIELVKQPLPMPKLPVARVMWRIKPEFKSGVRAWLEAGGAHHTVVSTALTASDMEAFAALHGIEFVHIG